MVTGSLAGKAVKAGDVIGYYSNPPQRFRGGSFRHRVETIPGGTFSLPMPLTGAYKTGTLGVLGKLFADFDQTGTLALLHGKEAVVTPNQMSNIITNSGQISVAEFVTSLNSNVRVLISMCEDELRLERAKLKALESAA